MWTLRASLIFLLCLAPGVSMAETITRKAPDSAAAIPQQLIDTGIAQVGPIQLGDLVKGIRNRIKFGVIPVFSIGAGTYGSVRTGSSCRVEDHTVFVNQPHLEQLGNLDSIEGLLLHESLCALGYDDDNYLISATLGAFRDLARKGLSGVEEVKRIIANQEFRTVFLLRMKKRDKNPRFTIAGEGSVTGIGGGGDGFAWTMKKLLFLNFYAFHDFCLSHPEALEAKMTDGDAQTGNFSMYMKCIEPRVSTWWNYYLNLSVEASMFHSSTRSTDIAQEMHAMGSFLVEARPKAFDSGDVTPIQITIDTFRMMMFKDQWTNIAAGIFMYLLLNEYPGPTPEGGTKNETLRFSGSKETVDGILDVMRYLPIWRCLDPGEKLLEDGLSYNVVPLASVYQRKKAIPEDQRNEPPHCVYLR